MMFTSRRHSGFTLIELLIVVAIIAILAAIAVPNFLEAQTRAKVSRVKADQRTLTTGLEVYHIDTNSYPHTNYDNRSLTFKIGGGFDLTLERLTTPIAYITGESNMIDPFDSYKRNKYWRDPDLEKEFVLSTSGDKRTNRSYWYTARNDKDMLTWNWKNIRPTWWFLESGGPDGHYHLSGNMIKTLTADTPTNRGIIGKMFYEPTNGTVSRGSIWRVGGTAPAQVGASFYYMAQQY